MASAFESPICAASRHTRLCTRYPDPLQNESRFINWINERMESGGYALIIPVTERTLVPLLRHREAIDDTRIAMAPSDALEQVLDKERTVTLATRLDIPVPRSWPIDSLDQLDTAAADLGYPMVIKPSRSVGHGNDGGVQLSVSYAHNRDDLEKQVRHALNHGAVILQEYFRGDGVGIELIADHGEIRFAFQHRRLHEVPLTGGGSSLRTSEAISPPLLAASEKLIKALKWHGVAMVEFKYDTRTGEFRLMEINGRFWGSLPLAIAAGADFPRMLYELICEGRIAPRPPARENVVCRQLARDVDWLEHVLRRNAPASLVRLPSWKDVLRDSALVFSPRHHFDVQSLRDPKPGLIDLGRIVNSQVKRVTDLLRRRWQLRRHGQRARQACGKRPIKTVLFLCYGNINRSALAHAYAAQRLGRDVKLMSAGFHAQGDRPADPVMVETAAAQGIDLSGWKSKSVDATMVASADLVLAMELPHIDRLLKQYPDAADKTFLLRGASAIGNDVEIIDPYGLSPDIYQTVCRQVICSVDTWLGHTQAHTER
ncbi:arsenate reductase/protein-tyrosine-phosphatase family protein [Denitromonas halophila]|uniref:arsenate reductase/protein-tyrosine-phosphatase family protein n=1 Tax=Denitromonas halophila TaxID=1629404 RepID=UPI00164263ED|nr:ATP-grasp domain-containing protein [Denitromonas halophila]